METSRSSRRAPPPSRKVRHSQKFKYDILPSKRSIRLLTLGYIYRPEAPWTQIYQLTTYDLTESEIPKYTALSYTWGSVYRCVPILVNGLPSYVTENLGEALPHLRRFQEKNKASVGDAWWIDSICVDQDNVAERGHQVSMMRQIFENAFSVVAWLGSFSVGDSIALQQLSDPATHAETILADFKSVLQVFFSRPFWNRVWIVQELCVAKKVILAIGDSAVPWNSLASVVSDITLQDREMLQTASGDLSLPLSSPVIVPDALFSLVRKYKSEEIDLGHAIRFTLNAECTDPRDRIFSLLGLAKDPSSKAIEPDYTLSACEVFCSAIRAMIENLSLRGVDNPFVDTAVNWCQHQPLAVAHDARKDCDGSKCRSWSTCSSLAVKYCLLLERHDGRGQVSGTG